MHFFAKKRYTWPVQLLKRETLGQHEKITEESVVLGLAHRICGRVRERMPSKSSFG